nr:hypothetical protein [Streptomyces sp. WM6368]
MIRSHDRNSLHTGPGALLRICAYDPSSPIGCFPKELTTG